VNCLLDALTHHTDLRATTLRIQFDGNCWFTVYDNNSEILKNYQELIIWMKI
jgi:hypothetical protein